MGPERGTELRPAGTAAPLEGPCPAAPLPTAFSPPSRGYGDRGDPPGAPLAASRWCRERGAAFCSAPPPPLGSVRGGLGGSGPSVSIAAGIGHPARQPGGLFWVQTGPFWGGEAELCATCSAEPVAQVELCS